MEKELAQWDLPVRRKIKRTRKNTVFHKSDIDNVYIVYIAFMPIYSLLLAVILSVILPMSFF